ncbi:MAG: Trp biosynthesis-associated membrane protein [Brevibacterium sp.]|uniref:Trp biosynthesis-associated membrane protein n=1 Tax=Brevibacterium sp. TaxID=1701 RepID=UPI0026475152|nr:Trp biosynthesis-associated membrane protein [Brevibacterium sp.]MDN5807262.1 Trp biosynthesis-associated membrane protein [Brevibacterium sp.]MDN5832409.1 Trp biosynthesis-associated membrane protein [Brevibacterium sp.]MDN5875106.1 Trp biosynthesis-associated membrane protein [Brevibacterium sp.]MDN5909169.1 Trp biosynthesis-associated membrane protein [Brevibacterium sp.]MDN6133869.1 Trp biosynthesis-associated membrane protein [Brevibacterium sp.]
MTKSRGVFLVLILAAALWAISLASWQAGAVGESLGPAGVADVTEDANSQASPVATACVAIIAVTGLLSAMLGKIGRFVVLGLASLGAVGYGITALQSVSAPGATGWPIVGLCAAAIALIAIVSVAFASAGWANSNRYARTAEAAGDEFDSAATWDALSRGDDPESTPESPGPETDEGIGPAGEDPDSTAGDPDSTAGVADDESK